MKFTISADLPVSSYDEVYAQRQQYCDETKELIKTHFNLSEDYYLSSWNLLATTKEKAPDRYNFALEVFHFAFGLGLKGRVYLWERLNYEAEDDPYCYEDFSAEEQTFLRESSNVGWVDYNANINQPIRTKRLELAPLKQDADSVHLRTILKESGVTAFESYTGLPYAHNRESNYFQGFPLLFGIYRMGEIIGTVGLAEVRGNTERYSLEYYIVPEQRCVGYMTEAAKALLDAAFEGKLEVLSETLFANIYQKVHPVINFVGVETFPENIASCRIAEKLGGVCHGIIPCSRKLGKGYCDIVNYTIFNPHWHK